MNINFHALILFSGISCISYHYHGFVGIGITLITWAVISFILESWK